MVYGLYFKNGAKYKPYNSISLLFIGGTYVI